MAEIEIMDAVRPEETESFELDQQNDSATEPQNEDANGTQEQDNAENQTGDSEGGTADLQADDTEPEKTLTQADFDRAFGKRANELRRQFQREHSADLSLASMVQAFFPGKNQTEIEEELIAQRARELAEETGWDEEQALKKARARYNYQMRGTTSDTTDPHVELLQNQINDIMGRYGVDIFSIVKNDEYLSDQINSGKMDFKDAYVYHMQNSGTLGKRTKKSAPPIEKRASLAGASIRREITDDEFKRIDEALRSGRKVRLE